MSVNERRSLDASRPPPARSSASRPARQRRRAATSAAAVLLALLGSATAGSPACDEPARLEGEFNARTPGVSVEFKRSVKDPIAAAAALAAKYHFRITTQYSWGGIFIWSLGPEIIEQLRCEPQVEMVEYNAPSTESKPNPSEDRN